MANLQQWQKNCQLHQQDPKINFLCLKSSINAKFIQNLNSFPQNKTKYFKFTQSKTNFKIKRKSSQSIDNFKANSGLLSTRIMKKSIYTIQKTINENSLKIYKIRTDQQLPIHNIFDQIFDQNLQQKFITNSLKKSKFLQIINKKNGKLYIQRCNSSFILDYQGQALLLVSDGRRIQGVWKNYGFQGIVKITYPSKIIYSGLIDQKFLKNSKGNLYFPSGNKFTGSFVHSKIQGKGKLYDSQQNIICQGTWKNGQAMKCQNF